MGCMHAWVWGERYPNFVDGLVPLACAPTQIAGRNRMIRTMIMDFIRDDPGYNGGDYTVQPAGLRQAMGMLFIMTSAPKVQHRAGADAGQGRFGDPRVLDQNDRVARRERRRSISSTLRATTIRRPALEKITAHVLAINSADDFVNPPELGLVEQLMPRVKNAKFILLPITDQTRGHGTHSVARHLEGLSRGFSQGSSPAVAQTSLNRSRS